MPASIAVFPARHPGRRLAVVVSIAAASPAGGQLFYTTEVQSGELRIVNYANGSVSTVGPLGVGFSNMDLAWHQGVLYGLDNGSGHLYSIATSGGSPGTATFLGALNHNGIQVAGEALASDGVSLHVAWGDIGTNVSSNWGVVGLTGTVAQLGTISMNPTDELDGAGYGNGQFWGIDLFVQGDNSNNYFYSDTSNPVPGTFEHSHSAFPAFGVNDSNDLVASIGTSLYTITSSGFLAQYGQSGGTLLGFTQLAQPGNYRGLEVVPAPATAALMLAGCGAVIRRRR